MVVGAGVDGFVRLVHCQTVARGRKDRQCGKTYAGRAVQYFERHYAASCPDLFRASRLGRHCPAKLIGVAGTSPAMTQENPLPARKENSRPRAASTALGTLGTPPLACHRLRI